MYLISPINFHKQYVTLTPDPSPIPYGHGRGVVGKATLKVLVLAINEAW